MKKRFTEILAASFLLIIGFLLVAGTTIAFFFDNTLDIKHAFLSGSLDLQIDYENSNSIFDINNLAPGETGSKKVIISNQGTLDFTYTIDITKTGPLTVGKNPLTVDIQDSQGSSLPEGFKQILSPGQEETLFIVWQMPIQAGNEYMGSTAQLGVIVHANQAGGMSTARQ